ncbi:DsbE family thiol:disulfide interchange protein [Endozoicomonas sp. OPT23]|uniref:DsbE family thiol:disulfide interchange protein n=1 Tax=Endozoicomonas sp. OPT23 TaxID=2072845 RepID=UPI00129A14ED|nr:DsbE family thiol:disulfide interchange protein [Endozoicomonas sp. OPT23]MRI32425.1 DsbE family thiol:disulfide interchange protein [Endozoicomonas sp. OPT23]
MSNDKTVKKSRLKLFLPLAFFLTFCILLYVGLFLEDKKELPSALLNDPVPEFSLPKLKQPNEIVTQETLKGQVYLLNVWGSWCPACKVEHPYLVKLAKRGVRIIGLSYKDEDADALRWLQRLEDPYTFNIVDKDGRLGVDLGVYGAPETFLVDKKGIIRYKHVGIVDQRVWVEVLKPKYGQLQKEVL